MKQGIGESGGEAWRARSEGSLWPAVSAQSEGDLVGVIDFAPFVTLWLNIILFAKTFSWTLWIFADPLGNFSQQQRSIINTAIIFFI